MYLVIDGQAKQQVEETAVASRRELEAEIERLRSEQAENHQSLIEVRLPLPSCLVSVETIVSSLSGVRVVQ